LIQCLFLFLTQGIPSGQSLLSCDFSSDGKIVASGGTGKKVNNPMYFNPICLPSLCLCVYPMYLSFLIFWFI